MERVREYLLSSSGDAAAACMICLETLHPTDPVWSCCAGCHACMHLPCTQSWARRTLAAAKEKAQHPSLPTRPGAAPHASAVPASQLE